MRTISLRYANNFAPKCGTIQAHQDMIDQYGYVWYGKLGNPVNSSYMSDTVLKQSNPRLLLIQSGQSARYWAYVEAYTRETPDLDKIPSYYRSDVEKFKSWFKITKFEMAEKDVMSKCTVTSSGTKLTFASMHSMNPCFKIDYEE